MNWLDWLTLAVYTSGMLAIGFWLSSRHKNFQDYFLAGRAMTTPLLVATLVSTYYGLDVLLGTSQIGYEDGVVAWFGYSRPYYIFYILAAFLLARRLRQENFQTLPDILDRYYGRHSRYVAATASFLYSLPVLSLFGFGMVAKAVFGWEPIVGALVFGGVALIYTFTGGLWAVALTDAVQFVVMCIVVAISIPLALGKVGGFEALESTLDPVYWKQMGDWSHWKVAIYAMTGLTVLVEPTFYQRIFAAKDYRHVRNALLIGLFLWGAYDWCVTLLGMAAKTGVIQGIIPGNIHENEALLKIMVVALPSGLLGLFLAGVFSTAMSTVDSYCLVAGGNVSYDIYRPLINPKATDAQLVKVTRIGVFLSWSIAFAVAFYFQNLMEMWVFLASVLTSTVLIPIVMGLYVKRWRKPLAGLLGSAGGLITAVLFYFVMEAFGVDTEDGKHLALKIGSSTFDVMGEYAMFFALPVSAIGYLLGVALDRSKPVLEFKQI